MADRTLIVAEAGVNHDGNIAAALRMVDVAADVGADVVKFQTFSADRLATRLAPKAPYQTHTTDAAETQHAMLRRLELTHQDHEALVRRCRARAIEFLSTAFDTESLDFLAGLGQRRLKIPSGEITNLPYLRHAGALGKDVLLSTGMASLAEVETAVDVLERSGTSRQQITVLHCTTEYPAPMSSINLRAMVTMRETLGVSVGYSDHTDGVEVALAAVALGAEVIEKHFTLDRNLDGPDHRASADPQELRSLIRQVRNLEIALGDGIKRRSPCEVPNAAIARKSIVATCAIVAGEVFTPRNVTPKRPGTGISPMRWDEVIGRAAPRDFAVDELIEL